MPSLNFTGLQKYQVNNVNNYTYSDLHLDFNKPIVKDFEADFDEAAIKNSIYTLFNTIPGQSLLNPEYGLNLAKYLFDPVNETNANLIGKDILKGIGVYEPRVNVIRINITVNEDDQSYIIELSIEMPILDVTIRIPGTLTKTGYILN